MISPGSPDSLSWATRRTFAWHLLWSAALFAQLGAAPAGTGTVYPSESLRPVVRIVEGGESKARPEDCRATLVGPGVNQPDPFPGYGGFVGWESPVRLKNGDWLVGFNAGYRHFWRPHRCVIRPRRLNNFASWAFRRTSSHPPAAAR